jgi:hypothetical protein
MASIAVQPGKTYWVEPNGRRFQVRVIAPLLVPGWYTCQSILTGDELTVPLSAFREEVDGQKPT